jgi:hypothetical protein
MKTLLVQILGLVLIVTGVWIAGERYGAQKQVAPAVKSASVTAVAPVSHPNPPVASQPQPLMAPSQWPEFLSARQAAFKSDPDLVADYKKILKQMDAQQARLDAAVVTVDPKLKPVMEKLAILRKKNSVPNEASTTATVKPPIAPSVSLTPEDLQELRAARMQAMKSNPDLVTNAKKIADQMRAFEDKLDAAMIKADPNVSPLIAKFEGGHNAPGAPIVPPGVK